MGFKEFQGLLIEALRSGEFINEPRPDIEQKNLLASRTVTTDHVVRLLLRCSGWEYSTSRHHFRDAECHIFTPALGGERWYVKAYWHQDIVVIVSVHQ